MKPQTFRSVPKLLPLAALLLACGIAHAANPPRVMFVSGVEAQPVLIDLQGKEILAKKGQVIPPGYSVKVPEGATVQIMTDEKAIVAVRQNSLLKLEKLGDGKEPHKFKLDIGGLRVANSEKKPHKFEVDTPNAKLTFDKGDHEAYYFKEGKVPDKWGTFVRGFKEDSVLTTKEGETKVTPRFVAYVSGARTDGKTEMIDRVNVRGYVDPVAALNTGSKGQVPGDIGANQRILSTNAGSSSAEFIQPVEIQSPSRIAGAGLYSIMREQQSSGGTLGKFEQADLSRKAVPEPRIEKTKNLFFDAGTGTALYVDEKKVAVLATDLKSANDTNRSLSLQAAAELTRAAPKVAPPPPPPPPPGVTPTITKKEAEAAIVKNVNIFVRPPAGRTVKGL